MREKFPEYLAQLKDRIGRRLPRIAMIMGALALVAGVAIWYWAVGAELRNLRAAGRLVEQGEYRRAQLLLEQAVQVRPDSVAAQRALAEFFDRVGSSSALERWEVVNRLAPGDEARWRLAASAVQHLRFPLARETLAAVTAPGRGQLEHHRLAAALALADGQPAVAEEHLAAMHRLAPENVRYRFALAAHRLATGQRLEESRRELEELARSGPLRVRATLELMGDAPRRWPLAADPEERLAERLFDGAGAVHLRAAARPGRPRLLAHVRAAPYPEPEDAAVLLAWLVREDRAAEALAWARALPEATRRHAAVVVVTAEAAARAQDWPQLQEALAYGAWGVIARPVLDEAFAVRAARAGRGRSGPDWQALLENAEMTRPALRVLWRLAELWGWPTEAERALTALTRRYPHERWAWEALQVTYLRRGDSAALWRHYGAWVREMPDDVPARLEQLLVAFLTRRGDATAQQQAAEWHRRMPDHPLATVVHALALRAAGRTPEGLVLLDRLGVGAWRQSRFALARAALLVEAGRAAEVAPLLENVREPLLPEERELLASVRRAVGATAH